MYLRYRTLVLRWLKVPPEPHPPAGDPASVRIFRAGKNYFKLRVLAWALPQAIALAGIIFWTTVLLDIENTVRAPAPAGATPPAPTSLTPVESVDLILKSPATPQGKAARKKIRSGGLSGFKQSLILIARQLPAWAFPLIWVLKLAGLVVYLAQIPFTYALRRLDYEMRWYIVTDRSLRIRTGIWRVQELTMSFANLQQVVVSQGPVQGFLSLADVRVQSAGGGGGEDPQKGRGDSLHTAIFHSVDNAPEIRDLILERLRKFRATGLGDHDDHHEVVLRSGAAVASVEPTANTESLMAAKELLEEARALRRALAG